jgi:hypothetical protein
MSLDYEVRPRVAKVPETIVKAAPLLYEACVRVLAEWNTLGDSPQHSGWCGTPRYSKEPCRQTGKRKGKCALQLMIEAVQAAKPPKEAQTPKEEPACSTK